MRFALKKMCLSSVFSCFLFVKAYIGGIGVNYMRLFVLALILALTAAVNARGDTVRIASCIDRFGCSIVLINK